MGQLGLVPSAADPAATLWVNGGTGNDANSRASVRAGGGSVQWQTIGRAAWGSTDRGAPNGAEAAEAGDVVSIAAGTYSTVGGGDRFDVVYNPVNEGSVGNLITFRAAGVVSLTYSSGNGPMIGSNSKDYIKWDGFTIDEATAPTQSDTGPVTFLLCDSCEIHGCSLTGNPAWTAREGDNYPGVRCEDASNITIKNNYIKDFGGDTSGGGDENHCGIETYRTSPITIEHNKIENGGSGIYLKYIATAGLTTVRYNEFVDNRYAVRIHRYPLTSADPLYIYQNLFRLNSTGIKIVRFDGGASDPTYVRTFNNTFYQNGVAFGCGDSDVALVDNAGVLFWNNICQADGYCIELQTTNAATTTEEDRLSSEHNVYYAPTVDFGNLGGSDVSLATWKATYSKDSVSPAAITSDPSFVNAGAGDYRLNGGSPALTQGRVVHSVGGTNGDTIPAGMYITGSETIGLVA